ncbi:hypothetical protein S40285_07989 [Stachybotrys chlorohalonatus IBT 40285]|uniref:Mediator of RNA polymerase II transcription subunit 12 n=1 Tax=Stachybotrys chlorohalonatus (strain IBT 40285) TaxID=1283841 RepID=A0A084Q9G4_STAC4|nr:hypothetical protein S40285_07989 [Stachybotrys chlorohalonata IBT 40285]
MGVQPRPPQRTLSNPSLSVQRPSIPQQQQRSLSTQYLPQSPVRKDSVIDLSADSPDAAQNRHGTTPRRGGSRLRLELSSEAFSNILPITTDSPQSMTPSRTAPLSDAMDPGNMSPALSRASQQDLDNPPMPMPKRRPPTAQAVQTPRKSASTTAPAKRDSRPKPYTIETPSAAPRFVSTHKRSNHNTGRDPFSRGLFSGYADFYPWNGNHHEDEWTTEAIQKGTWDRNTQTESASARQAIFPSLKQKSGLNLLSQIYTGILATRKLRGQITAPSTFKPPPRVTLTDTKREVWLRDLSNPAISLRRLSRTIPHGIRGRTLLDQCLNKNVPTERAVWLAKCVGANEIRAFKRKGVNGAFVMGGELKWVRDWTTFVEQFLDGVVWQFTEADWKNKVIYAIRLATHLYSDHLLDRDHYLEWIVAGLESSTQTRLPMWILIAQIYWADILRSRKHARRMVASLLSHLDAVHTDLDGDIFIQLSGRLAVLLTSLIQTTPESFVNPNTWFKYRHTLKANLYHDDAALAAFHAVDLRVSRLTVGNTESSPATPQQLVSLLDSILQKSMEGDLPEKCWATSDDKQEAASTIIRWAASVHRPGLSKVYVAARVIRAWAVYGSDLTHVILGILEDVADNDHARKQLMYRLITELARSGHFSIPYYFQWLIARGGYTNASEIDPDDGPCAMRLLVELPVHCFWDRWKIERANLLRRAGGYSVESEQQDMQNAFRCIQHALGLPIPAGDPISQRKPISVRKLGHMLKSSSRALNSHVAAQLRDAVDHQLSGMAHFAISLPMFTSVRAIMESTEDFAMFADILRSCVKASNPEVLASCADTINLNLRIFLALGAAEELFDSLLQRLRMMGPGQTVPARPLLAALSSLAERMPSRVQMAQELLQELIQNDRSNAIDACSPVSDSMMSHMHNRENEVSEEIEKLLTSGNSIDPPTMNRMFRNIVPRLDVGWAKADDSRRVLALLLARLRIFDTQHFDKLMSDWLCHLRALGTRPELMQLLPLLVSLGCISIDVLMRTANVSPPNSSDASFQNTGRPGSSTYLQELLALLLVELPKSVALTAEETYRFQIQQQSAMSEHSKDLLALIRNALLEYALLRQHQPDTSLILDDPNCQECILEALRYLVVEDAGAVAEAIAVKSLPAEAVRLVQTLVSELLVPGASTGASISFDEVLKLANERTMPFCQLKLNIELSLAQSSTGAAGEHGPSAFDLFAEAMDRAIEARNIMWTTMLPGLNDDIAQSLRSQACNRFLKLMPSIKSSTFEQDATDSARIQMAQNLLGVIESIVLGQAPQKFAQVFTSALVEKLADLWDMVAAKNGEKPAVQVAALGHWLPVLLRFIALHSAQPEGVPGSTQSGPITSKPTSINIPNFDARARSVLVLCGLMLELETLPACSRGTLAQQVFDLALVLIDPLPEEMRLTCAKSILQMPGAPPSLSASSDSRLYYLFSAAQPSSADNLMLAHREKPPTTSGAARALYATGHAPNEKLTPFVLRRWELLHEPTPNVGENDTSLNLRLFEAVKVH